MIKAKRTIRNMDILRRADAYFNISLVYTSMWLLFIGGILSWLISPANDIYIILFALSILHIIMGIFFVRRLYNIDKRLFKK